MASRRATRLAAVFAAPLGGAAALCAAVPQMWPEMSLPERLPAKRVDGSTDAVINYQMPSVTLVQSRRDAQGSDGVLHGADWDARTVHMENGRKKVLELDVHGFQLLAHANPRAPDDYYDEATVTGEYYSECEDLLKRVTGASFVAAFDHNVRCDSARAAGRTLEGGNLVQGPAGLVHGDYTAVSAPRRFELLGQPPKLNDALRGVLEERPLVDEAIVRQALGGERRYAFINVWRPIRVVDQKPLACAAADSVHKEDLITFQIVYADRIGENCAPHARLAPPYQLIERSARSCPTSPATLPVSCHSLSPATLISLSLPSLSTLLLPGLPASRPPYLPAS